MGAHRFWRLLFHTVQAVDQTYVALSELKGATAIGGAQALVGGTPSASTTYGGVDGSPVTGLFDGNINTFWACNGGGANSQWVAYDLGGGNSADIIEVTLTPRNDSGYTQAPVTADWQYSDDGVLWYTYFTIAAATWTTGASQTFDKPASTAGGSHRYWRFRNPGGSNNGNYISCAAVRFYANSIGATDIAPTATPTASGIYGAGYEATKCNDVNNASYWYSSNLSNSWLMLDFGSGNAFPLDHFDWQIEPTASNSGPKDLYIEWSDDGTTWSLEFGVAGLTWGNGLCRGFTNPTPPAAGAAPGAHRYWRLLVHAVGVSAGGWCAVGELIGATALEGPQALTGGVASASSVYAAGYTADKAFNGVFDAGWLSNVFVDGTWLKYDLGAGNAKAITQIRIYARNDGWPYQSPTSWEWQYSDDDVTYTTAFSHTWSDFSSNGQLQDWPHVPKLLVGKSNLMVTSSPVGGTILLGKTNIAVESTPKGGPVLSKTNLAVDTQDPPVLLPPRRRTLLIP